MDSERSYGREQVTPTLLALGLCVLAVAWPADSASAASAGVILSPAAGQSVPAGPVAVKVRASRKTFARARLNGRAVGDPFSSSRGGVRTLRLSPSHGL